MAVPNKVLVGRRLTEFPGRSFNKLVDGYYRETSKLQPTLRPGKPHATGAATEVLVHNVSGADVLAGEVLEVDTLAIDFVDDADRDQVHQVPLLTGVKASGLEDRRIVICSGPIVDDGIGRAAMLGAIWARVNIQTEGDDRCEPANGSYQLRSGGGAIEILYAELQDAIDGNGDPIGRTGEQWALIVLGAGGSVTVKTVLVDTGTVGAVWDENLQTLSQQVLTVWEMTKSAVDANTFELGGQIDVTVQFTKQIDVSAGKAIVGKVVNGELWNLDCDEIDFVPPVVP